MIDWPREQRIRELHVHFQRVSCVLKAYRLATGFDSYDAMEDASLRSDDQQPLRWDEREQVVLVIEQELRAARKALRRLLPARDAMALIDQATRDIATFREQFAERTPEEG